MDSPQRKDLANEISDRLLNSSNQPSADELLEICQLFGGAKGFFQDDSVEVRYLGMNLLSEPEFPSDEYLKALEATKLNRSNVYALARHRSAYEDPIVFQTLWLRSKNDTWLAILGTLNERVGAFSEIDPYEAAVEPLSVVYSDSCDSDNRHRPFEPRVFHADVNLELRLKQRDFVLSQLHPDVLAIIHSEILSLNTLSRERYGDSLLVANGHWLDLLVDKRPVLNSIARNALLPEEIARQIVATHKTPSLRESIAANTVSKDLLEEIWNGTKSESVRRAVAVNAVSEKYLTHPELILFNN